jgi:hypothetical protein
MPRKTKLILGGIALAVVAVLVVFGHEPSSSDGHDTCPEMGIDPARQVEGTCYVGSTKTVVVDQHDLLQIESLEAQLERIRVTKVPTGPKGSRAANRRFVTFDLSVTNRTDEPQSVEPSQVLLLLDSIVQQDAQVEGDEPDSFLARNAMIPAHGTIKGSVIFDVSDRQLEEIKKQGNLDIGNFRAGGGDYEPEALFEQPEMGVIRTYRNSSG